jgi:hypothetical protein
VAAVLASRDVLVRAATLTAALAAVVLALPALAACSGGDDAGPRRTTSPSPSATVTPPEEVLTGLATKGVTALFTGTYTLDSVDPKQADAKVTIYRLDSSYRVDVARKGATSILMTTKDGLVSCQVQAGRRTCLLVGDSSKPPPKLFDPGLQRLFTTDLGALASGQGITVTPAGVLPAAGSIGTATCFRVAGTGVDPGEYCLTDAGILRRAQFPSGTLELTALAGAPAASAFTPPATPTPLPS